MTYAEEEFNKLFGETDMKKSEHKEVMDELKKLRDEVKRINEPMVPYVPIEPYVPYVPPRCPYANPCPRGKWIPCHLDCWGCPFASQPDYWEYQWIGDDCNTAAIPMFPQGMVFLQHQVVS